MLLLLIAWLSIKSLVQTRKVVSILPMLFGVALGFGLSAPAWLALLDLVQGSARELPAQRKRTGNGSFRPRHGQV